MEQLLQVYGTECLLVLAGVVALLAVLGLDLFVVIGAISLICYVSEPIKFTSIFIQMSQIVTQPLYMTIPLFTLAGVVMAESKTPTRLVDLFRAFFGWMPGGLAIVAVTACAFFTAFTGGSGVTIIALGGLLYPVLAKEGYPENFRLGLLTSGGSLGLLFPPSLPLIIYALVAGSMARGVDVDTLFRAGLLPGLLLLVVLALYSLWTGKAHDVPRQPFSLENAIDGIRGALWELPIPVIVIGGIYGGFITPTEAAAVTAFYVLLVEVAVHRDIGLERLPEVMRDAMELVGAIVIIIAMALGLVNYLVDAEVPNQILHAMKSFILDEQELVAASERIRDEAGPLRALGEPGAEGETAPLETLSRQVGTVRPAVEDAWNAVAWWAAARRTSPAIEGAVERADEVAGFLELGEPYGEGAFIVYGQISGESGVDARAAAIREAVDSLERADLDSETGRADIRENPRIQDAASLIRELTAFREGLPDPADDVDPGPLVEAMGRAFETTLLVAESTYAQEPAVTLHGTVEEGKGGTELREAVASLRRYLDGLEAVAEGELDGVAEELREVEGIAEEIGLAGRPEAGPNGALVSRAAGALDEAAGSLELPPGVSDRVAGVREAIGSLEGILATAKIWFLLLVNVFLIIVGCLMEIYSALLVVVPILLPMALWYGVDPVHFGIIFLTNLELGYMTPPVGINLFLSSLRFEEPVMKVARSVLPFLGLLALCLLVITYWEPLTMALVWATAR